jgi:hypothetical protein
MTSEIKTNHAHMSTSNRDKVAGGGERRLLFKLLNQKQKN